ncbi:type II secretion system protein [Motilimonas sp. KMU-193]|uniref:type II secretion system protein n=1 Tax=Motilimonas sp. KMU-193 TaxID=3388668 RepID=UPI00396B0E14
MRQKGFTLIEVLVASVILVALLSALLPLFNQSDFTTQRAMMSNQRIAIERNIFNSIKFINPHLVKQGNGELADIQYNWRARAITPEVPSRLDKLALDRNRMLALYQIEVQVQPSAQASQPWQFQFELIGWEP